MEGGTGLDTKRKRASTGHPRAGDHDEGGIPGAPTGYIVVRKAVAAKKIKVAQVEKPKKGKK